MQRPQPDEYQSSVEDSDSTDDSAKSIISEISENQDSSDVEVNTEDWVHVDSSSTRQLFTKWKKFEWKLELQFGFKNFFL